VDRVIFLLIAGAWSDSTHILLVHVQVQPRLPVIPRKSPPPRSAYPLLRGTRADRGASSPGGPFVLYMYSPGIGELAPPLSNPLLHPCSNAERATASTPSTAAPAQSRCHYSLSAGLFGNTTPSVASLPSPRILARSFGRFDEILYLVEETSALTLPDSVRCHRIAAHPCFAREPAATSCRGVRHGVAHPCGNQER
jgi:hypothetical protein